MPDHAHVTLSRISTPNTTALLSTVAINARADRPLADYPEHYWRQVSPDYAEVWFPTEGCPWDAKGHCTTCNYGWGPKVTEDQMVSAVERAVDGLAPRTDTIWVSAFNTLFEREVPAAARSRIFEVLKRAGARRIITETHPATVRRSMIEEVIATLAGPTLGVELGVETMDEFIRYACFNKPFSNAVLERAVHTIHDAGGEIYTNLLVGAPFLCEREVIDDMVWSARACLELGCDHIVVFPNYVKDHTVAELLFRAGRYSPPDAWTLREVLRGLPRDQRDALHLGWLETKDHPGAANVRNDSDPAATAELVALLKRFDVDNDQDALEHALAIPAPRAVGESDSPLLARVLDGLRWLADTYLPAGWWDDKGPAVNSEVEMAFERFAGPAIRGEA